MRYRISVLIIVLSACSLCSKGKIEPTGAIASSTLAPTSNYTYGPEKAIDGNLDSTWAEGSKSDGVGEYLVVKFSGIQEFKKMEIVNGFASVHKQLGDLYELNNRIRELVVQFDDGSESLALADGVRGYQEHKFKTTHKSSSVKLMIASVYKGSRFNDACIGEVSFYGDANASKSAKTETRRWAIQETMCALQCDQGTEVLPERFTKIECEQRLASVQQEEQRREDAEMAECVPKHGVDSCSGTHGGIKRECVTR
jgi:hypothetical protein